MSRDRLNDYNSNSQSDAYSYPGSNTYGDKQAPVELAPLRGDASLQFFQETEVIQSKMQQFHASINEVEQLFNQNLNSKADPEGAKKLDEKTQSTNSLSNEIYDRLRALTTSNMKVRTKEEYEQRKLRTTTLSKQFKDAVARFQGMQYQNRQKSKETVARQLRIANPAATEEDIRRLVDEDQGGAFSQQLLQQARGQQAMAALNSVQSRQRELSSLQQSIVELSQLFTQLEQLISEQDMTFQEIEGNVTRAESDIEKGFGQVGLALKDGISARKKKWMALGIVVVILIIILIIGAAQGWFKKPAA
ncbi:Plasma membrane t-SNARE, secretory vesicle fusion [Dissophora globulifera]|nr:Plasma membrane t-SNARE, secretory vesicle fusion [Dissophora globulifera]